MVILDEEFYENLLDIMEVLGPDANLSPQTVSDAFAKTHMRRTEAYRRPRRISASTYRLRMDRGDDKLIAELEKLAPETLLVLPLDRSHPHAQARGAEGIRRSPSLVLAVPGGSPRPESEAGSPERSG